MIIAPHLVGVTWLTTAGILAALVAVGPSTIVAACPLQGLPGTLARRIGLLLDHPSRKDLDLASCLHDPEIASHVILMIRLFQGFSLTARHDRASAENQIGVNDHKYYVLAVSLVKVGRI